MVVSDQSDGEPAYAHPAAATMVRALRHRGHPVLLTRRLPRRGLAEHRAYLLAASAARYVLCLDDDVWLEPGALHRLVTAIGELGCGFVGNGVHGLSYTDDVRPETHGHYEEWPGRPTPERIRPGTPEWDRAPDPLGGEPAARHRAAGAAAGRVAGVQGLLDRRVRALRPGQAASTPAASTSGVGCRSGTRARTSPRSSRCWPGYGGAGVLPSGAYHLESPTTVTDRDVEAWEVVLADEDTPQPA